MTRPAPTGPTVRRMTAREWSAFCDGYEHGIGHSINHGYALAMADVLADLRQASHHLITDGWVPEIVRAHDAAQHRAARAATPPPGPDFTDPAAVAAYRARIRASWGLPPTARAAPRRAHNPAHAHTTDVRTRHAHPNRGAAA